MTSDERAIRQLVETWMTATRAGDTATVLGLMADDVIFMVPGQKPFGKDAFAASAAAMKDMRVDGTCDILEIHVQGDWAYLRNHIAVTISREGAAPVHRAGYTLTVLRKEPDGRWLLTRDANMVV